jgi:hypothetical protein
VTAAVQTPELAPATAVADSRAAGRVVELASGLLMPLDEHGITGRLPLDARAQASRLRHAVKLAVQATTAAPNSRSSRPSPAALPDPARALQAWISSQPWAIDSGPEGWVYLTLFWWSTGRMVVSCGWRLRQQDVVDLAGDEPLEAADDLAFEPSRVSCRLHTGCDSGWSAA